MHAHIHARSYTVHFTAKKVSQPTIDQERIIKNMSSRMQQKTLFCIQGSATAVQSERGASEGEQNASICTEHKSHPRKWGSEGERDGEGSKAEVTKRERPKEWQRGEWQGTRRERMSEGEK